MKIKIYVEGGGDRDSLKTACRNGFSTFFQNVGITPGVLSIVACGPRHEAFRKFKIALRNPPDGELPLIAFLESQLKR